MVLGREEKKAGYGKKEEGGGRNASGGREGSPGAVDWELKADS